MSFFLDENSPTAELIKCCANPPPNRIINPRVVQITDRAVIKFGMDVTLEEADNQRTARRLVDHRILQIPRVYRAFVEQDRGYIVMEFIKGTVIGPLEDPESIRKVAEALDHLAAFQGRIPGPLCGGPSRGLLWEESNEELTFGSVEEMEQFMNDRLSLQNLKVSFQNCQLVICHLDIAPRNILWTEDGRICLLDWYSAGYYPRVFEFVMQWICEGKEGNFNTLLLEAMNPLPTDEREQKDAICLFWNNIQRYHFPSKSAISTTNSATENILREAPYIPPPLPPYPPGWPDQVETRTHSATTIPFTVCSPLAPLPKCLPRWPDQSESGTLSFTPAPPLIDPPLPLGEEHPETMEGDRRAVCASGGDEKEGIGTGISRHANQYGTRF